MGDLENDIFLFIKTNQKLNGNKCGTRIVDISTDFGIPYKKTREIVLKLYNLGKIESRRGISENLIFLKDDIHR